LSWQAIKRVMCGAVRVFYGEGSRLHLLLNTELHLYCECTMTEYEVCQVDYEEFGIDRAKEIGFLDGIEAITVTGE